MIQSLITVVVPVYNVELYLEDCIDSILNQTYQNFEIILVDDGSTDNSEKICNQMAKINDKITVIHQLNQGVSAARNNGINEASGKYIIFVDADDTVENKYLEYLITPFFDNNDIDISICGYSKVKSNGFIDLKTSGNEKHMTNRELFEDAFLDYGIEGYPFNKLYVTDKIKQFSIKFDKSIKICEDLLFYIEYLSHVKTGFYNPKPLYNYKVRENSALTLRLPGNDFRESWLTEIDAYKKIENLIPRNLGVSKKRLTARRVWVSSFLTRLIYPAKNISKSRKKGLILNLNKYILANKPAFISSENYPKYDKIILNVNLKCPFIIFHFWKLYLKIGHSGLKSS